VPYTALPSVRCSVGAINCFAICTVQCWCHTLLCHLYGALLVPYTAVSSVRCTVGAIHCFAICTVHCWCHTQLCHLYGALLVPYTAVSSVRCTVGAIHCCAIFSLSYELSCLSASAILLPVILFHSAPTSFSSPPKPDTLPHNVLLSTKWCAISVRWVI